MKNKGFSLIELIIVIAIMGVLLTVLAPFFLNYLGKSQLAVCRENRDRLKKDMYEELIAFKEGDLEASAYLDEYMEKAGRKKVSENTYEGICPTTGVVTFSIDDINSVESISIHASCSVHGGDEIEQQEVSEQPNYSSTAYKGNYVSDAYLFTSNKSYAINTKNFTEKDKDAISSQYPYTSGGAGFYYASKSFTNEGSYLYNQVQLILNERNTVGSKLYNFIEELKEDVQNNWPSGKQSEIDAKKTTIDNNAASDIFIVNEIQTGLGDLYRDAMSGAIGAGTELQIKQYLYFKVKCYDGSTQYQPYVKYAERVVTVKMKKVSDANKKVMSDILNKGDYSEDTGASVIDLINDKNECPDLFKTDNWTVVDKIEKPY